MEIYKIWAIVGFLFLFVEILTPSMFFLPLGGAAFFAAVAAFKYPDNYWIQGGVFALFAVLFFITVRPFMRKKEDGDEQTGVEAKYIANEALVTKDIGAEHTDGIGEIKIYGEIWQAKSADGSEIKAGEMVKITKNESLIMFVEKINKE
ncbi:TPA: NfeD family protein [Candidatus Galligastranaerophilus faecipullorum]|nr:NfeD family protein [Candidatus Galligastranaerophilus faecipullorum]